MARDLSDAADREAAWLATTTDALPALLRTAGGPFDVIQAYIPRSPAMRRRGLYVTVAGPQGARSTRISQQRRQRHYAMSVQVWWPLATGSAETEQAAMLAAIQLTLQRIEGLVLDKTHGGRFWAVAEDPDDITVSLPKLGLDSLTQITSDAALDADITYVAHDTDFDN